jgi:deoxyribodipyrimidine photo-lyase
MLGSDLLVLRGKASEIIPDLVAAYQIGHVFTSLSFTHDEMAEEAETEQKLQKLKCQFHGYFTETLIHPDELPFPLSALPNVFTRFRKEVEPLNYIRKPFPKPAAVPTLNIDFEANSSDFSISTQNKACPYRGGEKAGLQRIQYYLWETGLVEKYKETRNGLLGTDYSTKFSPWLALGCISPRTIFMEIRHYEEKVLANDSTYWVVFELLWRDYFKFMSRKYGPSIFSLQGLKNEKTNWKKDREVFWLWARGKTGNPFVDANMKEMNETGFMSNRGRQNVASFLAKDLKTDWRWGAQYFESQLIDYDCSSNWGNWTYVAGVGADPRENRYFNTWKQAGQYDPEGRYIRKWLPEIAHLPSLHFQKSDGMTAACIRANHQPMPEGYPVPLITSAVLG